MNQYYFETCISFQLDNIFALIRLISMMQQEQTVEVPVVSVKHVLLPKQSPPQVQVIPQSHSLPGMAQLLQLTRAPTSWSCKSGVRGHHVHYSGKGEAEWSLMLLPGGDSSPSAVRAGHRVTPDFEGVCTWNERRTRNPCSFFPSSGGLSSPASPKTLFVLDLASVLEPSASLSGLCG